MSIEQEQLMQSADAFREFANKSDVFLKESLGRPFSPVTPSVFSGMRKFSSDTLEWADVLERASQKAKRLKYSRERQKALIESIYYVANLIMQKQVGQEAGGKEVSLHAEDDRDYQGFRLFRISGNQDRYHVFMAQRFSDVHGRFTDLEISRGRLLSHRIMEHTYIGFTDTVDLSEAPDLEEIARFLGKSKVVTKEEHGRVSRE